MLSNVEPIGGQFDFLEGEQQFENELLTVNFLYFFKFDFLICFLSCVSGSLEACLDQVNRLPPQK